mgnify:CR=1 FL=1
MLKTDALDIIRAAIENSLPYEQTVKTLASLTLPEKGITVLAIGKAAIPMAKAASGEAMVCVSSFAGTNGPCWTASVARGVVGRRRERGRTVAERRRVERVEDRDLGRRELLRAAREHDVLESVPDELIGVADRERTPAKIDRTVRLYVQRTLDR